MNLKQNLQKYRPQRSDLNLLKDGGILLALTMIAGMGFMIVRGLMS